MNRMLLAAAASLMTAATPTAAYAAEGACQEIMAMGSTELESKDVLLSLPARMDAQQAELAESPDPATQALGQIVDLSAGARLLCVSADDPRCTLERGSDATPTSKQVKQLKMFAAALDVQTPPKTDTEFSPKQNLGFARGIFDRVDRPPRA